MTKVGQSDESTKQTTRNIFLFLVSRLTFVLKQIELTLIQMIITKGTLDDLEELMALYEAVKEEMWRKNLFQWTKNYPNPEVIRGDISRNKNFLIRSTEKVVATVCLNEEQDEQYQDIDWKFDGSKVLVIHRLAVLPEAQGKGYARKLIEFSENLARRKGCTSIRLDTYSPNTASISLYEKYGFIKRGIVFFPERKEEFFCMEKEIV
ncbi:MAG: GNAT family N-acetyltransferase [Bacteroidota bacterium]